MSTPNKELLERNKKIEKDLVTLVDRYRAMRDARVMFARAHQLITHQINVTLTERPDAFRNPDQLIRFNISFATAFLAATAQAGSAPWRRAFDKCEAYTEAYNTIPINVPPYSVPGPANADPDPNAVQTCAMAMANVHINVDIVASLKTVGCIDKNDYGNVLVFVERAARQSIIELHGKLSGPVYDWLKRMLLPLDKMWRNSVYEEVCKTQVPDVEKAFIEAADEAAAKMKEIQGSFN